MMKPMEITLKGKSSYQGIGFPLGVDIPMILPDEEMRREILKTFVVKHFFLKAWPRGFFRIIPFKIAWAFAYTKSLPALWRLRKEIKEIAAQNERATGADLEYIFYTELLEELRRERK